MRSVISAPSSKTRTASALAEENAVLREQLASVQHQLDWFKKQLFGPKSETQVFDVAEQGQLFAPDADERAVSESAEPGRTVKVYKRGVAKKQRPQDCISDAGLRFNADVPVEVIEQQPPELSGAEADQYEVIGSKTSYRLAQRSASYVVLQIERPVYRRKGTSKPVTTPVPVNVLDNSLADVSLLAGLLVDKFQSYLPLYRQHQRMQQSGVTVARSTLTQLVKRSIELLRPIVDAQTDNVLRSRVLAMDETPIKAGHQKRAGLKPGKMKSAWFWPLYGDDDEVVFTYSDSRGRRHIETVLKGEFEGVLVSDGYAAYARYAEQQKGITHAQCWVHSRRYFVRAQDDHRDIADKALKTLAALYRVEDNIKAQQLNGDAKRQYRQQHAAPIVDVFFDWCWQQRQRRDLLPKDPITKALKYVLARKDSLRVFLDDPAVPMDTNHLERSLRPIPMGRKNWVFCWTELGAEHVGIIQSLITTCTIHGINPYTYLVDVLQRVGQHPASQVADLTPRLWKTRFKDQPLRSMLYRNGNSVLE